MTGSLHERFWSRVNKRGPVIRKQLGRCWLWTGSSKNGRYGNLWLEGKAELAHRISWLLATGEWPDPSALHKCDNTLCVRFTHLFEGGQKENLRDCVAKGRHRNGYSLGK